MSVIKEINKPYKVLNPNEDPNDPNYLSSGKTMNMKLTKSEGTERNDTAVIDGCQEKNSTQERNKTEETNRAGEDNMFHGSAHEEKKINKHIPFHSTFFKVSIFK